MAAFRNFPGKGRPRGDGPSFHPVIAHQLDTAAVTLLLPPLPLALPDGQMLPPDAVDMGWLALFTALHDIGKLSRPFLNRIPHAWPAGLPRAAAGEAAGEAAGPPHDEVGLFLLRRVLWKPFLQALFAPSDNGRPRALESCLPLLNAVAGHHGRPAGRFRDEDFGPAILCDGCREAALACMAALLGVFDPPPFPFLREREIKRFSWSLAGRIMLADWIGSNQDWFPYVTPEDVADPAQYFHAHAIPRAERALRAAGLSPARPAPLRSLAHLRGIDEPTAVQNWARSVPLPPGPLIAAMEDLAGSGKTEAALILAQRMMAAGHGDGLILAQTNMATANAMYDRIGSACRAMFAPGADPSLVLAHGRAALHSVFRDSIRPPRIDGHDVMHGEQGADRPSESYCAEWLADDRRRALLAQIGIGTIDQALLAILPVQYSVLRLAGLQRKILVVDEAHAFDPYMRALLETLLAFHASQGGSAILLSATLTQATRQSLISAFLEGAGGRKEKLKNNLYPLATLADMAGGLSETPCAMREDLRRTVRLTRIDTEEDMLDRIAEAAQLGAAVAWIRNTVDDAIRSAKALRARGIEAVLLHARFAMADRIQREQDVTASLGRGGSAEERKKVLITTQIFEMSLDCDVDLLCSDLAPVEYLIQRAGRLWRHLRMEARPLLQRDMLILSPEPVADPDRHWLRRLLPGTQAVYRNVGKLWCGARILFPEGRGGILRSEDVRALVEAAAIGGMADHVPQALRADAGRAGSHAMKVQGLATENRMKLLEGYGWDSGCWSAGTRMTARLEDRETVTLRLAVVRDGRILPYAASPAGRADDRAAAWAGSEVAITKRRVAACVPPAGMEPAAQAVRASWPRWERDDPSLLLAVMVWDGESSVLKLMVRDERGKLSEMTYDTANGLCAGSEIQS